MPTSEPNQPLGKGKIGAKYRLVADDLLSISKQAIKNANFQLDIKKLKTIYPLHQHTSYPQTDQNLTVHIPLAKEKWNPN